MPTEISGKCFLCNTTPILLACRQCAAAVCGLCEAAHGRDTEFVMHLAQSDDPSLLPYFYQYPETIRQPCRSVQGITIYNMYQRYNRTQVYLDDLRQRIVRDEAELQDLVEQSKVVQMALEATRRELEDVGC